MTTKSALLTKWWMIGLCVVTACVQEKPMAVHDPAAHGAETSKSRDLMLTDSQLALANIQTEKVMRQTVTDTRVVSARVVQNTNFTRLISSRVAGRVERLYVKETGKTIRQGEPLYEIYSEGLVTLQDEFLLAHAQANTLNTDRYRELETAARKKLLRYGLTEKQINNLVIAGKGKAHLTFLAPASGIVKSIDVQEGQTVAEGSQLYELDDLKTLRIEAELFANEADLLKVGDPVQVHVAGLPPLSVNVDFINPEFRAGTQTWLLWCDVINPGGLQPGMQAQLQIDQAREQSLVVPVDAVIRSEAGTHVYVETDTHTFQPRIVKTGLENFSHVEIKDGLEAGETVVVSGAYLIYSEYILKFGAHPANAHHEH